MPNWSTIPISLTLASYIVIEYEYENLCNCNKTEFFLSPGKTIQGGSISETYERN